MLSVTYCVGRVGINLQEQLVAEGAPHGSHRFDIETGFNLQLDAQIAVIEVPLHHAQQVVNGGLNAHRYT